MQSDIILEDENVEIKARNLEVTGNEVTFKDEGRKEGLKYRNSRLTVGNSSVGESAYLFVTDTRGTTKIRSNYISSDLLIGDRVRTKEINTSEIEIGPTASDSPKTSKLIVNNKQAEPAITIDGEKEDIVLKSIGSLTDKIKELEKEISDLKKLHRKFIKLDPRIERDPN